MLQDDMCVASGPGGIGGGSGLACGTGTHQDGDVCLPDDIGLACGPGTHSDGNECLPDVKALFELRAFTTDFPADGHTKMPVLVIGTNPDGSPATGRVVLNSDRPSAGAWINPAPTIGELGTMVSFVPCDATTPGCTGPLRLTLALATDPHMVIAHLDINLTEPSGVATAAPCMIADKAMYFDGNDFIFNGTMTITEASWSGLGSNNSIAIGVIPPDDGQRIRWDLQFDSRRLGVDLTPGVYEMAQRAAFADPGHPGLDIHGNGHGCNTLTGRFEVHYFELQPDHSTISRALVTFEQHCDGGPLLLSGCVRFE
jgi:hypothetical protein